MNGGVIIERLGRVPVLSSALRAVANLYPEEAVVRIRSGHLRGRLWQRSHRYVNGYWLGIYELPIQDCLVWELKKGDVFFDIGANAGFFSLLAAGCVGDEGQVVAFEPLPINQEAIKRQFSLNRVRNGTVVAAVISDCVGQAVLCEGTSTSTAHIAEDPRDQGIRVLSTTLDEFCTTGPAPDFIKLDVEEAEVKCLRGASSLLRDGRRPRFLIEWHGSHLAREGMSCLISFGYQFQDLRADGVADGPVPSHVVALPGSGRG